jgi:hypothetical protein
MRPKRRPAWPNWRRRGDGKNSAVLIARWIVSLLLVAAVLCFAMYLGTGQVRFRSWGLRIVKFTLVVALGFFAVLILERMAMVL